MNNFLEFIEEDIQNKKTLFSTMPVATKPNIKKFNEKVETVATKYEEYRVAIKRYLDSKNNSFEVKVEKNTADIINGIKHLEYVRFMLNPHNTYFEKMGFDTLIYQISNYHDFKFDYLIQTISDFLSKFEAAGIFLADEDFDYTCYVNEFMNNFLTIRKSNSGDYSAIAQIFEKLYWVNPELVEHIELNFRKLIKKHEKIFIEYIKKQQDELTGGSLLNYDEVLLNAYRELSVINRENISDIIEMSKTKKIDINHYFEDSKVRTTTFASLMIEPLNVHDETIMSKFNDDLEKLKHNVEEYEAYLKFVPLITHFKSEYLKDKENTSKSSDKNLKDVESEIEANELKLDKLNKKIATEKDENYIKGLKFESTKLANQLSELYRKYDDEYFKNIIHNALSNIHTVADLFRVYYYFDYFKKFTIKKVFNVTTYAEIVEYSNAFDLIAMNPLNVILNGITFDDNDTAKVIVNKYRIININITEGDLSEGNTELILNRINFVLRANKIEKSGISVEKIWFMSEVARINLEEQK